MSPAGSSGHVWVLDSDQQGGGYARKANPHRRIDVRDPGWLRSAAALTEQDEASCLEG